MAFTAADQAEWEQKADELIAGAGYCNVTKAEVVNGLRFYATAKKFMEHYECNAFSAPLSRNVCNHPAQSGTYDPLFLAQPAECRGNLLGV